MFGRTNLQDEPPLVLPLSNPPNRTTKEYLVAFAHPRGKENVLRNRVAGIDLIDFRSAFPPHVSSLMLHLVVHGVASCDWMRVMDVSAVVLLRGTPVLRFGKKDQRGKVVFCWEPITPREHSIPRFLKTYI